MNSRLDTLQAAILLEKLAVFEDEIAARQVVAARYAERLARACLRTPSVIEGGVSTWAQYVIEHPNRDGLAAPPEDPGRPHGGLLPCSDAPPDALRRLSHRARAACRSPRPRPGRAGPADAPLPEPEVQDRIIEGVLGYNG